MRAQNSFSSMRTACRVRIGETGKKSDPRGRDR
jgi:hypothetical protein